MCILPTVQVLPAEPASSAWVGKAAAVATAASRASFGMPRPRSAWLDPDQAAALNRLTSGGDFPSVLTAPAGAGKLATLGATALVWQQAGYRVIGLAPSARAASELAAATGGRTETQRTGCTTRPAGTSCGRRSGPGPA